MEKIILILIFLTSCKSTKSVEKVETIKNDSLVIRSISTVQPNILSSLVINEICDTLTDKAKEFRQIFVIGQDTMAISLKNNNLNVEINQLKRILKQKDSVYKNSISIQKELKKETIIKYRVPRWAIFVMLLIPVFIIFPAIVLFLNRILTKLF
jgi:2-phospho-L-lactate transferase/gluconeogenesis factor (CofD/UPF0052 family)